MRAKDTIVDGYFTFADIRNDGWPKSKARPSQPGIVLSFDTKRGRISMPCDTFTDWEANLRAIALTLENLRAVERYGVTTDRQEQYTGWLKLSAANARDEALECARVIAKHTGEASDAENAAIKAVKNREYFDALWSQAAHQTHPDKGGRADSFRAVIVARDRIRLINQWT